MLERQDREVPGTVERPVRRRPGPAALPVGVSNHALARALAGGPHIQRRIVGHVAQSVATPRQALQAYLKGLAVPLPPLPKGVENDPAGQVDRPDRVEAEIDASSVRTKDRDDNTLTNKVTGMAKAEQFLTQGAAYSAIYHGGHLIADQLMENEDSFVFWNVAPQWGTFNTPEYRKMETLIVKLAKGEPKKTRGKKQPKKKSKPVGRKLMVTAKVTYDQDQVSVPPAWLRTIGVNVPVNAPDLTFHRRTPSAWTLRARAVELPKKVPKTPFAKGDWKSGLTAPLPGTGFTTKKGYARSFPKKPEIEHRLPGSRAPSQAKLTDVNRPSAKYAAGETWKMRTIQWFPKPQPPGTEEVNSIVEKWFPLYDHIRKDELAKQQRTEWERAILSDAFGVSMKATSLAHGMSRDLQQLGTDDSDLLKAFMELEQVYLAEVTRLGQVVQTALGKNSDRLEVEKLVATFGKYVEEAPEACLVQARLLVAAREEELRQLEESDESDEEEFFDVEEVGQDDDEFSGEDEDVYDEEDDEEPPGELAMTDTTTQPQVPNVQQVQPQQQQQDPGNTKKRPFGDI